jgi:hypothetical protein
MSNSLLFVDANVAGYQTLLNDLAADTEVFLLNDYEDGVAQIADVLKGRMGGGVRCHSYCFPRQ